MGIISNLKDRVVENKALSILNESILQPYGKATSLRIDSSAKTIDLDLELRGETVLVQIQIKKYELIKEGGASYAVIKEIQTSRGWLTTLAEQHLLNRRLELPPQAAGLLLRFL